MSLDVSSSAYFVGRRVQNDGNLDGHFLTGAIWASVCRITKALEPRSRTRIYQSSVTYICKDLSDRYVSPVKTDLRLQVIS